MAKYDEIRHKIRTGDVLAWSHRGGWFKSWYDFQINLVRLFTRSEYSHVGIAVVWAKRVMVIEAVADGIRLFPLSKLLPCYWIRYHRPFDLDRAMLVCGEKYSKLEAIRGELGTNDPNDREWQCAEFVAWAHDMRCKATPSYVVDYTLRMGGMMQEIV